MTIRSRACRLCLAFALGLMTWSTSQATEALETFEPAEPTELLSATVTPAAVVSATALAAVDQSPVVLSSTATTTATTRSGIRPAAAQRYAWLLMSFAALTVLGAVREVSSDSSVDSRLDGFPRSLESLQTPAAVTARSGRILLSNGHLLQLFPELASADIGPVSLVDAIAGQCAESHRSEARSRLDGLMAELRSSPEPREVSVICSKRLSLRISVSPQIRDDSQVFLLWVIRNQGAEHLLEERDEHSRKMRTITRFAGGMAHEFNNILTAILGNLELMRARPDSRVTDVASNIESAEVAALRASQLIQELRRFASREIPTREVRSISRIIRRTVRILTGTVPTGTKVTLAFDDEADLYGLVNADQLQEALLKLAANAMEALGPDGGRIHFEAGITLVGDGSPSMIQIDVTDTGHGMSDGIRELAFEPLFTTKDSAKSIGLGMSIAHGLIEEMGGEIRIADTSEQGTVVSILLPQVVVPGGLADESSLCDPQKTIRVATVEHELSVQNVMQGMLVLLGHEVGAFGDGKQLLEALREGGEFDLVIIDHVMPGMTGRATYEAIRQINQDVPVIICSGQQLDINRFCRECDRQPDAFLKKPFSLEELQATISRAL